MRGRKTQCWLLPLACVFEDMKVVAGQSQTERLDILRGISGQSSCTLRDTIHSTCNPSLTPPALDESPVPSPCTCNNVYFNIWSACSYSSENKTFPVFKDWESTCTTASVDLAGSANTASTNGGLGIDVPTWAVLEVPNDTIFDIQRAVQVAVGPNCTSRHWSILQIVAPLISAVVAILMTFAFLLYCRPRIGQKSWPNNFPTIFHPRIHRVRPVPQPVLGTPWTIDQEPFRQEPPPHMADPVSPGVETSRFTTFTLPGNPSAPPSAVGDSDDANPVKSTVPGGRVYPFDPNYGIQNIPFQRSQLTSNTTSNTSSIRDRLPRFRLPRLKPSPTPIKVIQPSTRFRVDPGEQSLKAISSARTSSSFGPRGSDDIYAHEDAGDWFVPEFSGGEGYQSPEEEESTSLIPGGTRTSLSADTTASHVPDSSINSHVGIIPPSNSSSSPRESRPGSYPIFSFSRNPPPLPPPPTQPAPVPPAGTRTFRREGPLGQLPMDRVMETIHERDRRTPSPMLSLSSGNMPRPSIDNPRPLPPVGNSHQRSNSQTGSASSIYEETSVTGNSSGGVVQYPPSRSASGDSQTSYQRGFSRPLPASPGNSIPLQYRVQNTHQRTPSNSSNTAGANPQSDPFVPPASHGRGLDWDDDGGSFYLEAASPPLRPVPMRPVRSPSPLEELVDPSLLFHPSVRGAGYRGTPPPP